MHRTRRGALLGGAIAVAAALALSGCSSSDADSGTSTGTKKDASYKADKAGKPDLDVSGAFIPEPNMPTMASGFLTVTNKGGAADRLTSVTSDISSDITLHSTKNGVMKQQRSFDVPADGELVLARGGNHLMLEKLERKPKQGDKVTMTLHFEKSGAVKVEVPVKEATYNPAAGGGKDGAGSGGKDGGKDSAEHDTMQHSQHMSQHSSQHSSH